MGFLKYILISLGVIILIIFGIVIFNRGGTENAPTPGNVKKSIKLSDFITKENSSVESNVSGAINALENHRAIQIIITPTTRTINVYSGYNGQVIKTKTYNNTQNAYGEFVTALGRAGFTRDRKIDANVNPEAICPTGSRTHYKLFEGTEEIVNLWTATCTAGTYGGNVSLTNTLFRAQIPDYSTITNGVNISTASTNTGIF